MTMYYYKKIYITSTSKSHYNIFYISDNAAHMKATTDLHTVACIYVYRQGLER
jgi:hypothetical protein